MKKTLLHSILSMIAVLLLAACGSSGLGDILGGNSDPGTENNLVRGTVDRVDTSNRTIVLTNADMIQSSLRNSSGTETIYLDYDENTFVEYGGQRYEPAALERGDRIEANATRSGNRLVADEIQVTYDVSGGTNTGQTRMTELRGIVRDVDTRNRTLSVERDSWDNRGEVFVIEYETNTPVYRNGQTYGPKNLERGDVIDLELRDYGTSLLAQQITVVESASPSASAQFDPDLSGTVQWVDSRARTITIEHPTWMRGFDSGISNSVTLEYDGSTTVVYNGQNYRPENLERGDHVEIEVDDLGATLLAREIMVVKDARQSSF